MLTSMLLVTQLDDLSPPHLDLCIDHLYFQDPENRCWFLEFLEIELLQEYCLKFQKVLKILSIWGSLGMPGPSFKGHIALSAACQVFYCHPFCRSINYIGYTASSEKISSSSATRAHALYLSPQTIKPPEVVHLFKAGFGFLISLNVFLRASTKCWIFLVYFFLRFIALWPILKEITRKLGHRYPSLTCITWIITYTVLLILHVSLVPKKWLTN